MKVWSKNVLWTFVGTTHCKTHKTPCTIVRLLFSVQPFSWRDRTVMAGTKLIFRNLLYPQKNPNKSENTAKPIARFRQIHGEEKTSDLFGSFFGFLSVSGSQFSKVTTRKGSSIKNHGPLDGFYSLWVGVYCLTKVHYYLFTPGLMSFIF